MAYAFYTVVTEAINYNYNYVFGYILLHMGNCPEDFKTSKLVAVSSRIQQRSKSDNAEMSSNNLR